MLAELNPFLLKLYLHLPVAHLFNALRLCLIAAAAAPSVVQFYFYLSSRSSYLGSQALVFTLITLAELLLAVKMAPSPQQACLPCFLCSCVCD